MKILSINVSLPKEVDWQGRRVRTSIFKTPVTGKRHVARLNIEGDGQSDLQAHGGEHRAVFVYQKESYEYWQSVLGRDDFHYGQFGENLTVEGLADAEVCIGDRFAVGTVVLEVTQPRVTCYKVAISTGVREMPALLVRHKRPGFYCRVIQEGDIEAGNPIVKLSNGKGGISVVEVDGLLYSNAHPADRLQQALQVDALSTGWRYSLQALYDAAVKGEGKGNAGLAPPAVVTAWQGFISFVVSAIVVESEGVRSFELQPADGRTLPAYAAGQHIVVRIPATTSPANSTAGKIAGIAPVRMYSLCGPVNKTAFRIAVKEEANGVGSRYLHQVIKLGDRLDISAPRGIFTLAPGARPLVLLGAGIGITPLLAMLYAAAEENHRPVWFIYTTQDNRHYPFRREIPRVTAVLAQFHAHTFFTRPRAEDVLGEDYDAAGRPDRAKLASLQLPPDGDYFLCGPNPFMTNMTAALKSLGLPDSAIHQEAFGSDAGAVGEKNQPHPPAKDPNADPAIPTPVVTFAKTGISFNWQPRFNSLLEAAEACNAPVSWSCRVGVCHRCETTLFSGEVDYTSPPLDPPAGGNILICCSVPRTDCQLDI